MKKCTKKLLLFYEKSMLFVKYPKKSHDLEESEKQRNMQSWTITGCDEGDIRNAINRKEVKKTVG